MRVGKSEERKVIVTVKTAQRDGKSGKIAYETFESIDVYEASAEEVTKAVSAGLITASRK